MTDPYQEYINGWTPLPGTNRLWQLSGAGLEHLGVNDKPTVTLFPDHGPDDLLIRHDACGLCFSDVKVIRQGQTHPRIHKDMEKEPVVLGHEVCFTVVGVGENLKGAYKVGDRLTLQPDIYINGVGQAYGYAFQGGLSQYGVISPEIRHTDRGDMLIRLPETIGYAEASLFEPWACVLATYHLAYRNHIQSDGRLWIVDNAAHSTADFSKAIRDNPPVEVWFTNIAKELHSHLIDLKGELGFKLIEVDHIDETPADKADDIILLNPTASLVENTSRKLADGGVMALCTEKPLERFPQIDVGRIHYNRWLFLAGGSNDIAEIYSQTRVRSELKPNGTCWFAGSGGPIGRMHIQRALGSPHPPARILCTDISPMRLESLVENFTGKAETLGIEFACLNPAEMDMYNRGMEEFKPYGFNDIIVLAPVPEMMSECSTYLAQNGVMNIFAGIRRGIKASLDFNSMIRKNTRLIGHSGSELEDMLEVLDKWERGALSTNQTVAAIGSLEAAKQGYQALMEARYPGKVVIYPHIRPFPLTGISELKEKCPAVYAKLSPEGYWTNEAEAEFLKRMLPQETQT